MEYVLKTAVGILCLMMSGFCYWLLWTGNRAHIDEVGYRSQNNRLKRKKRRKNQPLWDYLSHWSLCKGAKQNQRVVWIYFSVNLSIGVACIVSVILFSVCLITMDIRNSLVCQLGFAYGFLLLHTFVRFVLDLTYVPSVQKRYPFFPKNQKK